VLVSVLMAAHDAEAYVGEAIDSVLAQTHTDLELIVVDDGSTDSTPAILAARAARDPRIRVVRQPNAGPGAARNRGLALARGEWVFVLDADDLMLPERIARQLEVVACRALYISPDRRAIGWTKLEPLTTPEAFRRFVASGEAIALNHSSVAFHRLTAQALGGYRPAFRGAEDSDLWNRIAETGRLVLMHDDVLVEHRLHPSSLVSASFRRNHLYHQWMRACMRARRAGREEPGHEAFLADWDAAPLLVRLDRERKLLAKGLYRAAALDVGGRRFLPAFARLVGAVALQPGYALPRLLAQLRAQRTRNERWSP
jgi:glycosyltransferase involved in cell wall biosynthesis